MKMIIKKVKKTSTYLKRKLESVPIPSHDPYGKTLRESVTNIDKRFQCHGHSGCDHSIESIYQ